MTITSAFTASYTALNRVQGRVHPLVTLDYGVRTVAMLMVFVIIGSRLIEQPVSPIVWVVLALQGLAWPQVAFLVARSARDQRAAEHRNLLLDAAAVGAWTAFVGASLWPSTSMVTACLMGIAGVGGLALLARSVVTILVGFGAFAAIAGFTFRADASRLTIALCIVNIIAYTIIFALFSFKQSRRLITARKLSDEQGREITEAMQELATARDAAEEAQQRAQSANHAKSMFLANMSHELRTPLNAIAGYTQLLTLGLRGTLSDQQLLDVARIGLASNHLMALVTDVLNFARLESGHVEYQIEDMDIAPVLAELEPLLGPQLSAKHLSFDHDGCVPDAAGEVHRVMADAEKLRQILLNLLTNAIKFTDDGGRIALSCENDEAAGVSRVHVSDTGRGIPSDQLERIFEPFVQVDRHRTPGSQQGVGLGLAISRDLARGMGGDLTVTSTVGVGSTLTLSLPRA